MTEAVAEVQARGFALIPSLLCDRACDELLARLEEPGVRRSRAGARHLLSFPPVCELAQSLKSIACEILGADAFPFRATLFDKSVRSNWAVVWHQDTALPLRSRFEKPGWGPWSTKDGIAYAHASTEALERVVALRLHLDDSTEKNGPLRVLPGTHRLGVLSDDEVAEIARRAPAVSCIATRGGVFVMRPLIIHSSSKCTSEAPRRVLHIEYAAARVILPEIELATA